jgi:hypothetical protein
MKTRKYELAADEGVVQVVSQDELWQLLLFLLLQLMMKISIR